MYNRGSGWGGMGWGNDKGTWNSTGLTLRENKLNCLIRPTIDSFY